MINWLSVDWLNDEPLHYDTNNGFTFTSSNWDMRSVVHISNRWGNVVDRPQIGLDLQQAMFEFGCFFGGNVLHRLNGFRGYDAIEFKFTDN